MSKVQKDTRIHLVAALVELKSTPGVEEMIREAKAGEYHDYKNQKYPCGKVAVAGKLHEEALKAETPNDVNQLMAIRQRVIDGEFDEIADEIDKAELRKTTPKAMWGMLGL